MYLDCFLVVDIIVVVTCVFGRCIGWVETLCGLDMVYFWIEFGVVLSKSIWEPIVRRLFRLTEIG